MRKTQLWILVGVVALVAGLWLAANTYEAFQLEDDDEDLGPCREITNCRQCAAKKGCGWCRESGKCLDRDGAAKPKGGFCGADEFIISDVLCESRVKGKPIPVPEVPDPCRLAASCGDCTQLSACMWCPKQKMCLSMDRYGFPMSGDCHPSTALVYPEQCGMLPKPATGTAFLGE
jgi:hypothetical protein